jgi:hypothetical protein
MLRLDEGEFRRRPSNYPIDIFVGRVIESHREIAIVDSTAYPTDDEATRVRQLDELRVRARKLGGDAIHDVRILTKNIKGYTIDERTPFPVLKQGEYPLYFVRGVVVAYESGLPGAVSSSEGFTDEPEGYLPPFARKTQPRKSETQ